jgi:OmpA-OmpF porin, OOP family
MIFALLGITALAQTSVPPPPPPTCDPFILFFDYGSTKLTVGSQRIIDNIVSVKDHFGGPLTVVGHADAPGSPSYNRRLSKRRAEAVKAALIVKGLRSSDLVVVAMGETRPLVETGGAEAQNRRVEVANCG